MRRREVLATLAGMTSIVGLTGLERFPLGSTAVHADDSRTIPLPKMDLHVHRDGTTLDKLLEISAAKGVKFGVVEHAGTRENEYPVILSNDDELRAYLATMDGKPCYRGVQAEWLDWTSCFSKEALLELDYVLGDAMTVPGPGGKRSKLWLDYNFGAPETFMDMYTEFHVELLHTQPLDIFANPGWLPEKFANPEELWTEKRLTKIVDALVETKTALELNSDYRLPCERMIAMAKEAGARFSFGTNIRGPKVGDIGFSLEMAKKYDITIVNLFVPGREPGAIERRLKK